jgi:hypothetical protein
VVVTPTSFKVPRQMRGTLRSGGPGELGQDSIDDVSPEFSMAWSYHWCVQPPTQRRACETTSSGQRYWRSVKFAGLEMQPGPSSTYKRAAQGSAELCPCVLTITCARGPRHFDITWDDEEEMECPVPLCAMTPTTHDAMRQHFATGTTTRDSLSMRIDPTTSATCA